MTTIIKSPIGIGLVFFYTLITYVSSGQSGILSNLYRKATEEKRPLILVLDKSVGSNSWTGSKDSDHNTKRFDFSSFYDYEPKPQLSNEREVLLPYSLLEQLGLKHYPHRSKSQDRSHSRSKLRSRLQLAKRSQTRLRTYSDDDNRINRDRRDERRDRILGDRVERDRRDRHRNYRERLYQSRYYSNRNDRDRYDRDDREELDRQDQNKYDRYRARADGRNTARHYREFRETERHNHGQEIHNLQPNRHRYDRDRRDRIREVRGKNDRVRSENSYKTFLEKNYIERNPTERRKETMQERALRNSVIKHFLRYSNDLNCDALDECAKECDDVYVSVEADDCVNECDKQFECEDSVPFYQQRADVEGCDFADSCLDSTQTGNGLNPSTRGILLEKEVDLKKKDDDCITKQTC